MSKVKARSIVIGCWVRIFVGFGLALGLLVCATYVVLNEYLRVGSESAALIMALLAACMTLTGTHTAQRRILRKKKRLLSRVIKQVSLTDIVEDICKKREHPVPDVHLLADEEQPLLPAGMVDHLLGQDALFMLEGFYDHIGTDGCRGIVAHELRHSNAFERKLGAVLKWLSAWFAFLVVYGGMHYVWIYISNPNLSGWHGFGNWCLAMFILFALSPVFAMFQAFKSRAEETKTDVLAAVDLESTQPLVTGLIKTLEWATKHHPKTLELSKKWPRFFLSHPTLESRIALLQSLG